MNKQMKCNMEFYKYTMDKLTSNEIELYTSVIDKNANRYEDDQYSICIATVQGIRKTISACFNFCMELFIEQNKSESLYEMVIKLINTRITEKETDGKDEEFKNDAILSFKLSLKMLEQFAKEGGFIK